MIRLPRPALLAGLLAAGLLMLSAAPAAGAPRPVAVAPSAFVHPGVFLSAAQLAFIRARVRARAQPWTRAYEWMLGSHYASSTPPIRPRADVDCGPYSVPDIGCTDELQAALNAYTLALAYEVNGRRRFAAAAIRLMNAWSATIRRHTGTNAPLQSAWAAVDWTRAAELIRYSRARWPARQVARFAAMLRTVYLPEVMQGNRFATYDGNWDLTMRDAAIGIAVFTNDRVTYLRALRHFLARVPAYIYLRSDGRLPVGPPGRELRTQAQIIAYWQGQSRFVSGLAQETCRDFEHTGYGLDAIAQVAETARIQGDDLYRTSVGTRLRDALEFHSTYRTGTQVPGWLCGGHTSAALGPVTEVGYNALSFRLGFPMPRTRRLTLRQRPTASNGLFVAWETLTNAENPY